MTDTFEYTIRVQLPEGASEPLKKRLMTFCAIVEFGARLFAIKNHEYGDTIKYVGLRGTSYEILGAAARLHHLVNRRADIAIPNDNWKEMVGDVLIDTVNFGVIGSMLLGEGNLLGEY